MLDCHFHLDESMVSMEGLVASMDANGIERLALIGRLCPPLALPSFARHVLPLFRRAIHSGGFGHRAAVAIYRSAVKKDGTVDLLGRRYALVAQPDNDAVAAAVKRHPDRFVGFVFVNPVGPVDPVTEVERCMREPGMVGVKAHPFWHDYPVQRLVNVAKRCEEKGWPMLLHLGAGPNGDYRLLPESFPRLKVVYAHCGIPYSDALTLYVRERKNVYIDLSSSAYVDQATAAEVVRRVGAARCLFGTDGPYFHASGDRFDFQPFVERLRLLAVTEAERSRIGGGNFREVAALA